MARRAFSESVSGWTCRRWRCKYFLPLQLFLYFCIKTSLFWFFVQLSCGPILKSKNFANGCWYGTHALCFQILFKNFFLLEQFDFCCYLSALVIVYQFSVASCLSASITSFRLSFGLWSLKREYIIICLQTALNLIFEIIGWYALKAQYSLWLIIGHFFLSLN